MRYQFVKQDGIKDCGVSCLLMIIRTYKGGSPKEYLRELTHTTKDGTTAYDLLNAGEKFHFTTFALKGNVEDLKEEYFPVIAHVVIDNAYQHFIVIYKMNSNKKELIIADPATGIKKITFDEFYNISTNIFLIFLPNTQILKINMQHPIPKLFLTILKKKFFFIVVVLILSFLYATVSILLTFYFQSLLNQIDTVFNISLPYTLFIFFSFLTVLKSLIQYIRIHFLVQLTSYFDSYLLENVYHHLFELPDSYFKNRTTGEVLARITDLSSIKDILSKFLLNIAFDLLLAIASIFILFKISPELTCFLIIFAILNLCLFVLFKNKINQKTASLKEEYAKINSFLTDSIQAVLSIKHLDREKYIEHKFKKNYSRYLEKFNEYQNSWNVEIFCKNLLSEILQIILITLGCYLISKKQITIAEFMTFLSLSSFFLSPLESIYDFALDFQNQKESIERIKELYYVEKTVKTPTEKVKIESVNMKNITFRYQRETVLDHIDFTIKKKEKVLIYGKSGCGKSTFIKILAGYLEEYEGNIYINDILLEKNKQQILQKNITYVSQEEILLNMSIKENILLGREVTEKKFKQVCKLLHIDDFVSKNVLAYDMIIEENGMNLSGGERQRIILARSLLRDSEIYIFDENFCNMDISLERKVLENIFEYLEDKIVIVISHRFYNADLYNRKIELQKGGKYAEINII